MLTRISSLSSMVKLFNLSPVVYLFILILIYNNYIKPLYISISSFALFVNGVWTSVYLPSDLNHFLGFEMDLRNLDIFSSLFLWFAIIFSLSIVYSKSVSLFRTNLRDSFLSASVSVLLSFIFYISLILHSFLIKKKK